MLIPVDAGELNEGARERRPEWLEAVCRDPSWGSGFAGGDVQDAAGAIRLKF